AHFPHAAGDAVQQLLPRRAAFVGGEGPAHPSMASEHRRAFLVRARDEARSALFGNALVGEGGPITVPDVWSPGADWMSPAQRTGVVRQMLSALGEPGGMVLIRMDVGWSGPGARYRPFAGAARRGFAMGVATASRLAQCPVLPFVAVFGSKPRTALVEWGEIIPPPARDDRKADVALLDTVADYLEKAVARYATQYQGDIGVERAWDQRAGLWA
ncbi:MAG: hypothetical protein ACRDG3_10890, partial [Tepidiformaceae bacterium]